jgi:hypothetical protein
MEMEEAGGVQALGRGTGVAWTERSPCVRRAAWGNPRGGVPLPRGGGEILSGGAMDSREGRRRSRKERAERASVSEQNEATVGLVCEQERELKGGGPCNARRLQDVGWRWGHLTERGGGGNTRRPKVEVGCSRRQFCAPSTTRKEGRCRCRYTSRYCGMSCCAG